MKPGVIYQQTINSYLLSCTLCVSQTLNGFLSFPFPALLTATVLGILHAFSPSCKTSRRLADVRLAKPSQLQNEEKQEMQKGATSFSQTPLSFGMMGIFNND